MNHDDKISTKNGLSSLKESKTKIISLKLAGNIGGEWGYDTHKKFSKGGNNMGKLATQSDGQYINTEMLHLCTDCKSFFGGEFSCLKKMIYYIAFY